jgi:hypothetical protein
MNLDEAQRKKVTAWVTEGLKLSEIQNRINSELGISATYMDVRFLVDDLKLTPKDVEPPKVVAAGLAAGGPPPGATRPAAASPPASPLASPAAPGSAAGSVSVSVDQIARPGAVVSGKVTFSDGNKAEWSLDQTGRLGLAAQQAGYRPPAADLQQFQAALELELSKMGY